MAYRRHCAGEAESPTSESAESRKKESEPGLIPPNL